MKTIVVLVTDEEASRLAETLAKHDPDWPFVEVRRLIAVVDLPEPQPSDEVIEIIVGEEAG
jgi:hypothetical protein